ncbi:MAG: hypothetical protein ABJB33_09475 [Gemmatimonadota bacterium]
MNRIPVAVSCFVLAACGHSLWPTTTVVTPVSVSETFTCVDSVAKTLGYKPFQSKPDEGFLRTRKTVTDASHDIFDQLAYDQLKAEIATGGAGTTLAVTAESYTEQVSRRGREQVEKEARPAVVADAKVVLDVCGSARQVRSDRVPSVN